MRHRELGNTGVDIILLLKPSQESTRLIFLADEFMKESGPWILLRPLLPSASAEHSDKEEKPFGSRNTRLMEANFPI
jgi:hypothetical protein